MDLARILVLRRCCQQHVPGVVLDHDHVRRIMAVYTGTHHIIYVQTPTLFIQGLGGGDSQLVSLDVDILQPSVRSFRRLDTL